MSATEPVDIPAQAVANVAAACLSTPATSPLANLQTHMVDRIKRAALRHLHASRRGELLLLRMYLAAEEAGEGILHQSLILALPASLKRQARQHFVEETAHAALFAAALDSRGTRRRLPWMPSGLGSIKLTRWRRLAARHAQYFERGPLVPVYATTLCAEQLAVRIMQRHCETIGTGHALHPLLARVLADEVRHVRMCVHCLECLVAPHEVQRFAAMLAELRKIDAAFGVSGALVLYAAGLLYRVLPGGRP